MSNIRLFLLHLLFNFFPYFLASFFLFCRFPPLFFFSLNIFSPCPSSPKFFYFLFLFGLSYFLTNSLVMAYIWPKKSATTGNGPYMSTMNNFANFQRICMKLDTPTFFGSLMTNLGSKF